ncbi:MAG: T9SS type B sorting domain-containing protein, partial [Bacteroidia bacterium]
MSLCADLLRGQNVAACNAAQPVCSNPNFNFSAGPPVNGLPAGLNISNPSTNPQGINSGCLLANGPGPQWLLITVSSSGMLGFSFGAATSPNPQVGFYDWAMWPYTPTTCASIFANTLPPVACNWNAASSGGTGMGTLPVGGNPGNFQPSIPVTVGQQYLILISNYSGVTTPVSFSNTGTANLTCNPYIVASQTICNGTSAVINATTSLTSANYTLTPGPVVNTTGIFNVTPSSTTNYTIAVTGMDNTMTVLTKTTTTSVTVLTPTVAANSASTICQGASATLTASATGTIAYSWTGPGGYTSSSQTNTISNALPSASGVYSVQAASTNGTLVCYAGNTTTLTVVPTNSIAVSAPINICQTMAVNLTANAASASSYSWNGPGGYSSAAQNPSIANAMPANSGIYTVTAFFTAGTLTCNIQNSVPVTVNPKVNFTLTPIPNVCDKGTISVNGPAAVAATYTWTGPNNYTSYSQNLTIPNASTVMSGIYSLSVTMAGGCVTGDNVTVNVLPPLSFSIVPINRSMCQGDTVTLRAQAMGSSGIYNYTWTPQIDLGFVNGPYTIAGPSVTTQYAVVASDAACPSVTISANVTVSVHPLPKPNASGNKISGCSPLTVNLNSGSVPSSVNTTWQFGNNLTGFGDTITYSFLSPGIYSITVNLEDANGCKSTNKLPFVISVYPHPQADFTWNPYDPTLIEPYVNFTSSYVNGPITKYFWFFADTSTYQDDMSGVKDPTHEFSAVGLYPVTLVETNVYGCTDTITKVLTLSEDFTMYIPNTFTPNGDGINDQFMPKGMGFRPESFEMLIFDRWGTLIFKTNDIYKGWDGTVKGALVQNDVYIYKVKCITGVRGARKEYAGHVT